MRTVCGWCPSFGRTPALIKDGPEDKPVSHGLCETCKADLVALEAKAAGMPPRTCGCGGFLKGDIVYRGQDRRVVRVYACNECERVEEV